MAINGFGGAFGKSKTPSIIVRCLERILIVCFAVS